MKHDAVLEKVISLKKQGVPLPLRYLKRTNEFVNYKKSCGFNPETFSGHSYGWYALTKKINGVNVLNTYRYSMQTSKHINKVSRILYLLNLKYIILEAPNGLQNLDTSKLYVLLELEKAKLAQKHARSSKWSYSIKYFENQIENLKRLGIKITKQDFKDAEKNALMLRVKRLEHQKYKRLRKAFEIANIQKGIQNET